jgi:hypothetical protein
MRINRTTLVDDTDQILREAHRLRSNAKNSLAGPDHMLAKAERLERIHEILRSDPDAQVARGAALPVAAT